MGMNPVLKTAPSKLTIYRQEIKMLILDFSLDLLTINKKRLFKVQQQVQQLNLKALLQNIRKGGINEPEHVLNRSLLIYFHCRCSCSSMQCKIWSLSHSLYYPIHPFCCWLALLPFSPSTLTFRKGDSSSMPRNSGK